MQEEPTKIPEDPSDGPNLSKSVGAWRFVQDTLGAVRRNARRAVDKAFRRLDDTADSATDPLIIAIRDYVSAHGTNITLKNFQPDRRGGIVTLMEQGTPASDVYIVTKINAPLIVKRQEQYSIGEFLSEEEYGLAIESRILPPGDADDMQSMQRVVATLDSPPFVVGEMAHMLPGNSRSATVTSERDFEAVVITKAQYAAMLTSPEIQSAEASVREQRTKKTAEMMQKERRQRVEIIHARLKALRVPFGEPPESALDVLEHARHMPQRKEFGLVGFSKKGEKRACKFEVCYETMKSDSNSVSIVINSLDEPGGIAPSTLSFVYELPNDDHGASVTVGSVEMEDNSGFGFTSMMYPILFKDASHIESRVIEVNTTEFIKKHNRLNFSSNPLSHAELAAHSPIVAARHGFISMYDVKKAGVDGDWYSGKGDIHSYKINKVLEDILSVATDLERCLAGGKKIELIYNEASVQDIIVFLDSALQSYQADDAGGPDGEYKEQIAELTSLQHKRIKKLRVEHCKAA